MKRNELKILIVIHNISFNIIQNKKSQQKQKGKTKNCHHFFIKKTVQVTV